MCAVDACLRCQAENRQEECVGMSGCHCINILPLKFKMITRVFLPSVQCTTFESEPSLHWLCCAIPTIPQYLSSIPRWWLMIPVSPRSRYTAVCHSINKYRETAQVTRYRIVCTTRQWCRNELKVTVKQWVREQQSPSIQFHIFFANNSVCTALVY